MIQNQMLRLMRSVYHVQQWDDTPRGKRSKELWGRIRKDLSQLEIGWNAVKCQYTFRDGSSLPQPAER